jgi:hypothetical protein
VDLNSVVLEQNGVFGVQAVLQVISMENALEFSKEVQRSLNVGNDLKVLVNVLLELSFNR